MTTAAATATHINSTADTSAPNRVANGARTLTAKEDAKVREALTILHSVLGAAGSPGAASYTIPEIGQCTLENFTHLLSRTNQAIRERAAEQFAELVREVPTKWEKLVQSKRDGANATIAKVGALDPDLQALMSDKLPKDVRISYAEVKGIFPPGATDDQIVKGIEPHGVKFSAPGVVKGKKPTLADLFVVLPLA